MTRGDQYCGREEGVAVERLIVTRSSSPVTFIRSVNQTICKTYIYVYSDLIPSGDRTTVTFSIRAPCNSTLRHYSGKLPFPFPVVSYLTFFTGGLSLSLRSPRSSSTKTAENDIPLPRERVRFADPCCCPSSFSAFLFFFESRCIPRHYIYVDVCMP